MDEQKYCPYCMSLVSDEGTCPVCKLTKGSYVPAPHHLLPGTLLQGRYLLGRVLGEGGFGITYVGRDTRLGVKIAVKEYYPVGNAVRNNSDSFQVNCVSRTTGSYERGKEKFLKEARTMGKLEKEPQIVAVKDFFEENNTAYIVMEYIEGTTLKELTAQRGGKIPADELFEMIKPLFPALQRMHDLGLIHRDISPDNLMLENGNIRLLDFGCAKEIIGEMMQNQQTQTLILKHGYSPFEQYQMSNTQGPWTDVYALGASIYYCLTGGAPPRSTDRILDDEIVPPHKLGVKIEPRQEAVLMRALAVKSMDRYRSMKEFSAALYNEPLASSEPEDKPIKLNNRKPRKVRQPAVKPNDLTVREGRIEVPVPEKQEEPEKLFITDEVPVTESAVDDTADKPPETSEESTTSEKPANKKSLALIIVAIILVIALAVTGIVLAVTGAKKGEDNNNDNVVASTTEKWLPIAGVDIGSYQSGSVSYDAYTRTISFNEGYSAIGWEFSDEVYLEYIKIYFSEMYTLKLEVTYADGTTVDTGYAYDTSLSLTPDPTKSISHIALQTTVESGDFELTSVMYREGSGEEETEEASVEPLISLDIDITIGTAGEGSAVIYWDVTELLESFYDAVSQEDVYIAVTADSTGIKLALHVGSAGWQYVERCSTMNNGDGTYTIYFSCQDIIDLVSDLGLTLEDIRCVYIDSLTWKKEIHVTGFELVDESEVQSMYPWTLEYTDGIEYYDEDDGDGEVIEEQWLIDGIVAGEQAEAGAFVLGDVVFINYKGEHMSELIEAIQGEDTYIEIVSYAPRSSYLILNIQFTLEVFCDWLSFGSYDSDSDWEIPLYTVTENDDGTITYLFSCSKILEAFEENGYDVNDLRLVSLECEEGTVFKSFSVIQYSETEAESESADKVETVLYSKKMTDSGELSFLQDYDFTDPELYLYIYCTVDEEYLGYGPCGLCSADWAMLVGAGNDPENALTSSEQTNEDGYMAVQLSYVAEVFSDAGYDVSDGVILNWWAFIGDDPYASLTKVELVRVSG